MDGAIPRTAMETPSQALQVSGAPGWQVPAEACVGVASVGGTARFAPEQAVSPNQANNKYGDFLTALSSGSLLQIQFTTVTTEVAAMDLQRRSNLRYHARSWRHPSRKPMPNPPSTAQN